MQIIKIKPLSALAQNKSNKIASAVIDSLSKLLLPKATIILYTVNTTVKTSALHTNFLFNTYSSNI
jgi:hypothetical protein